MSSVLISNFARAFTHLTDLERMHEKDHRVNLMPTYSTSLFVCSTFSFRELFSDQKLQLWWDLKSHHSQNHNTLLPRHSEKPNCYVALKEFVKLHIEIYHWSVKGIASVVLKPSKNSGNNKLKKSENKFKYHF